MLLIELDKSEPVIEELIPLISHKQPKVIAAALSALTAIYHAYGVKVVEPKPVIKCLPKPYGHADKNVRAEAQNLTVEFYRWLKDAMKPLFWSELKPVQQSDLEKLFEKVKDEPAPKQERLLRSQQAAAEAAADEPEAVEAEDEEEEVDDIDLEPEVEFVDVFPKMPADLNERLGSSKWKDRKEVLEEVHTAVNHPAIEEGPFDDLMRGLAKSMKDANVAVVILAANIVEILAKGMRKGFPKYRSTIMSPMLERFKEKKQSVTDALAAACDAVAAATGIQDNIEEILEFMKHKNPLVKLETARFLSRSLKAAKQAPNPPEIKPMADAATKLLTESLETTRNAGAEVLGVLWKIMGDRNMLAHLEGLDDIRKAKVKEFCDQAEVKSKWKPKAAPPPKPAAAPPAKKPLAKRPTTGPKKAPAPVKRPVTPPEEPEPAAAPLAAKPTSRPASKLAPKTALQRPGIGALKKPGSAIASPRRSVQPPPEEEDEEPAPAAPRLAPPARSLAARPLGKPAAFGQSVDAPPAEYAPPPPTHASTLSNAERAELSDLRAEVEFLRTQNSDLRTDKLKLNSQLRELESQNEQLIDNHTRDGLSIKAKEAQLVRARAETEAAEERASSLTREVERLKREVSRLGRQEREPHHMNSYSDSGMNGMHYDNGSTYGGNNLGRAAYNANKTYQQSGLALGAHERALSSEGKENVDESAPHEPERSKFSPTYGGPSSRTASNGPSREHSSSGRGSPYSAGASGARDGSLSGSTLGAERSEARASVSGSQGAPVESWRRAAEVTQNLKARIEMMKVRRH